MVIVCGAVAEAVACVITAYSEENDESDYNEPQNFIVKNITETIHIFIYTFSDEIFTVEVLSFFWSSFSYSDIILCKKTSSVTIFGFFYNPQYSR